MTPSELKQIIYNDIPYKLPFSKISKIKYEDKFSSIKLENSEEISLITSLKKI